MKVLRRVTRIRSILAVIIILALLFPFHSVGIFFPQYLINGELIVNSKFFIVGFFYFITIVLDLINFYLTKFKNMEDEKNELLDAIIDKILINSTLIILSGLGFIPNLIPVVVITRDIVVRYIDFAVIKNDRKIKQFSYNRYKNILLFAGIILILFYNLPFELWNLRVADFLLSLGCVVAVITAFEHYRENKDLIF